MPIELVIPSSHLILCCPLLLLPPTPRSIRVFSNESALCRWPKYWSFSFSISPSNEHPGLISFRMDWLDLLAKKQKKKKKRKEKEKYRYTHVHIFFFFANSYTTSWVGICWSRKWQLTPVFLLGKSPGQRAITGCSPWGCKESDTAE